jgi:uncharacterized protein (TIGR03083 family)
MAVDSTAFLVVADRDARRLLDVAETDWGRPVPHCPGWDAAELVRHTGGILQWMAAVVESGERVSRRTLGPAPEEPADLPQWYLAALAGTLGVLGSADPSSETWTFSATGDTRVGWWCRRLAVEAAIHRWDMEDAVTSSGGAPPEPLDGGVAAAGIEEFIVEFLPGLLSQEGIEGLGGTLHLHATDGPVEWCIDLEDGKARAEHAKADTAIRATQSDVLLWLTNRARVAVLDVHGSRDILDRWGQLNR